MRRVMAMVGVATMLGGCATLSRGTSDEVAVISDPPGAAVTTSLGTGCAATPCTLQVGRRDAFSVTVSKPGYESRTVQVATRLSGAGAALASENITTAGLGLAVDAATGATLEHVPGAVSVTLRSLEPASAATPPRRTPTRPAHPAT